MSEIKIGLATPVDMWTVDYDTRRGYLESAVDAGVDHIFMADHVSFRNGSGTDGFAEVAALSQLHPTIGVMTSIYLLPLRHPLPVARQLATMHEIAPGRMTFGIGIGGEDRHEVEICGVDPRTRGRLTNESLDIIRQLMTGETINFDGEFFQLEAANIRPVIGNNIPIIVGGRSNAALTRTGRFGDGWIATWCSVRRFEEALTLINDAAYEAGRTRPNWLHGYQPWVGIADNKEEARKLVSEAMERFYKIPFEKFERYVPYGTPEEVANELAPYAAAGSQLFNLKVVSANDSESIAATRIIADRIRGAG